ncbi:MAG: carboxymuconolactone decarboxylase family protein [Gammaproteobacteria bacterium]|nr:carboxymuconolactone decarboxylase family protein [Gammaproteobacteria bacterium]
MRLTKPRIEALMDAQLDADAQALIAPIASRGRVLNIFRTLCNHSGLAKRWMVFANHILGKSTLDPKERELVILRIGFLCNAGYEWGQHVVIARQVGLTDEEILLAKSGPRSLGISTLYGLLLQATDELHGDAHIADATWQGLLEHYNTQQMMDLVFTVGQYNLVSMALNSFGVQLDDGVPGWDLK